MTVADEKRPLTKNIRPGQEPLDIAGYERAGGYQGLRAALKMTPLEVQEIVKKSGLRGRGGAGFPTGVKWSVVPMDEKARRPKYFVVNADEMEPGTMKDRLLLEGDPHELVEGIVIGAYAVQAEVAYIYLRWDYRLAAKRLSRAIAEARERGYLGAKILGSSFNLELYVHISTGRYMAGEETGLMNALEGKRITPRNKPPFPQQSGLWGHPTIVNNAETVCNVPHILANGPEWFKALARSEDGGTKIFGVSGRVKHPGLWELPMGTPLREILEEHSGGMQDGYRLKGLLPGGGSTDFLVEQHLDTPMDYGSVQKAGSRLGTGTIIVLDDRTCPIGMLVSLERFFARESCGWCTPCREGLPWVTRLLIAIEEGRGEERDIEMLEFHTKAIRPGNTFCALAPGAIEPLESGLKFFKDDFARHVSQKRCPYHQ